MLENEKTKDAAWQGRCSGTVYIGGGQSEGHFSLTNEAYSMLVRHGDYHAYIFVGNHYPPMTHLSSITSIIRLLLKPDKSVHIKKSFPSLSFVASPPAVFTSPHVNSHKESRFLIRHHLSPEFSSDDGDEGTTSLGVSDALHLPSSSIDVQGRCDIKSSMEEFNVEALEPS